jgi:hypothetical protein
MQDRILEECFRIIHEGVERAENVYEIKVIVFFTSTAASAISQF